MTTWPSCSDGPSAQPIWYIDAVNGNDRNDGDTPATALASQGEFDDRTGYSKGVIPLNLVTVNILSDLVLDAPVSTFAFGPAGSTAVTYYKGAAKPPLLSDTITAKVDYSSAGNQYEQITAAGLGPTHVNKRIRMTSGASSGAFARIILDMGGGQVVTTRFQNTPDRVGNSTNAALPQVGDTFVVEDFFRITGIMVLESGGSVWEDLDIVPNTGFITNTSIPQEFRRCLFGPSGGSRLLPEGGALIFNNSLIQGNLLSIVEGKIIQQGGGVVGTLSGQQGAFIQTIVVDVCMLAQGSSSCIRTVDRATFLPGVPTGVRGSVDGYRCGVGGLGDIRAPLFGGLPAAAVSGYGINIDGGGLVTFPVATPPTVPATTGNVQLNGATTTYAVPAINPANNATYALRTGL